MTHYDDGRRFEYQVRNALKEDGYELVARTAGSKTKVDIFAFKQDEALFVQAKRDGRIGPAERADLLRFAGFIGAVPLVAWKRVGASPVLYWRLTGPGPKDRETWTTDLLGRRS